MFDVILFALILSSTQAAVEWKDQIIAHQFTIDTSVCNGANPSNKFDARISKQKTGTTYAGTIIFVPGGSQSLFFKQRPAGTSDGIKFLEDELYDEGFRVIEVRFDKGASDTIFEDTHSCTAYNLGRVLEKMKDEDITGSSPLIKWWPPNQSDRYAFGQSYGQIQLQFTIDIMPNKTYPFITMNRVTFAGGGSAYDHYESINCVGQSQTVLDHIEHQFDGSTTKCMGSQKCGGDLTLRYHVGYDSSYLYIGRADDGALLTDGLFNTGPDIGCNQKYNIAYYNKRNGSNTLWNVSSVCGETVDGHGIIDGYYDKLNHVDDWVDFYVSGDTTFDPVCP